MDIKSENNGNVINNFNNNANINKLKSNENFIPSYMKNKDNDSNINKIKKDVNNKKGSNKRQISKLWILIILLVIIILVFVMISKISYKIEKNKTSNYDRYMEIYGFSQLYNNGKLTSTDEVKKSELVKMVVASTLNIDNDTINSYVEDKKINENFVKIDEDGNTIITIFDDTDEDKNENSNKEKYKNENWVIYAVDNNLIKEEDITDKNYDDNVTYIEAIEMLGNAKVKLLNKNLDTSKVPDFKNYDEYTESEQFALCDLVENGIIENSSNKLDGNKKLTKGVLNELIIKSVIKYNLITEGNDKINILDEKKPSNENDFPYTLANIDKSVYEMENYKENDKYQTPAKCYANIKKQYSTFKTNIELYYNTLLNVNYQSLDEESFRQNIIDSTNENVSINKINEYINYIKENNIQITGEAKIQYPIIYFDGNVYRVRTKLDYNIENSKTLENILFNDINTKYNLGKNSVYIDVPINKTENGYYIVTTATDTIIAGRVKKLEQEKINNKTEDIVSQNDDLTENVPIENNSTDVQNNEDSKVEFVEEDNKVELMD